MNLSTSTLLALWEQSYSLSFKIEELLNKTYSSEYMKKIIIYVKEINEKFLKDFSDKDLFERLGSNAVYEYSILFKRFYECVGAIRNCNAHLHPYEVMIPIEEILTHIQSKHLVLTEPIWEINYYVGSIMEGLKPHLKRYGFNVLEEINIIRLGFPVIHQDNVLLGAIMGHELGHYLDIHYGLDITSSIMGYILNKINYEKFYSFLRVGMPEHLLTDEIKNNMLKFILPKVVLKNWIKEIVADVVGISLYGLASHFSCEQIFLYSGITSKEDSLIDRFSQTHPKNYLRSEFRIHTLEVLGYYQYLNDDIIEYITEFNKGWQNAQDDLVQKMKYHDKLYGTTDIEFIVSKDSYEEVEKALFQEKDSIVEAIVLKIQEFRSSLIFNPENIKEKVLPLVEKIVAGIPPNEIHGIPVESVSIINAGWIAYLTKKDEINENWHIREGIDCNSQTRELVNSLTRKALNASNIHRRWNGATPNK